MATENTHRQMPAAADDPAATIGPPLSSPRLHARGARVLAALRRTAEEVRHRTSRRYVRHFIHVNVVKTKLGLEPVRNAVIDARYGGWCGGEAESAFPELGANGTTSVDYSQLERIFSDHNGLEIKNGDVLVDVGCGKGRVLNWWLRLGLDTRIVGIELDDRFAAMARCRLADHANITVITGDALEHLPPDATILFLFNPFDHATFERLRERLVEVYGPRSSVKLVYFMPRNVDVFDDPRFTVERLAAKTFYSVAVIRMSAAQAPTGEETHGR